MIADSLFFSGSDKTSRRSAVNSESQATASIFYAGSNCGHRMCRFYSYCEEGATWQYDQSKKEIYVHVEEPSEWNNSISTLCISDSSSLVGCVQSFDGVRLYDVREFGLNIRHMRSIRCSSKGIFIELSGRAVVEDFSNNVRQFRRKLVHDVVSFRNNGASRVLRACNDLLAKRAFVFVFYHGSRIDFESVEKELGFKSTFRTTTCEKCEAEHDRENIGFGSSFGVGLGSSSGINAAGTAYNEKEEDGDELFGCREYSSPHWHIVHDCQWNSSSCKCFKLNVRRRLRTHDIHADYEGTVKYFVSLLQYSNKGRRRCIILQAGAANCAWPETTYFSSKTRSLCYPNEDPINNGFYTYTFQEEMGEIISEHKSNSGRKSPSVQSVSTLPRGIEKNDDNSENRAKILPRALVKFAYQHATYPINAINQTLEWLESRFCYTMASDQVFIRAMQHIMTQTSKWTMTDFVSLYTNCKPVWGAVNIPFNDYYYSVYESVEILEEFICFQANVLDEEEIMHRQHIKQFLKEIFPIFERTVQKKNTIYVVSPPSAGKNFFFDTILTFYLNCGNVANFNRNNQFPFQDCVNRRVLLWNEPNFMPSATDTIKMLTGGDTMHVNVKYQNHVPVYKTPLLVLSNNHVFHDAAFRDRIQSYEWQPAPYLKNYKKKPHPLAWPYLLHKHKVYTISDPCYSLLFGDDIDAVDYSSDNTHHDEVSVSGS